jgi:hypothetical protein
MPIINIFVPPPPSLDQSIRKEIDRVKEITKDKNLKKSSEKLDSIGAKICKEYKSWERQTKDNRANLVVLNEMLESVVPVTNFPFEGASNITISYASGVAKTFKATFNKTAYQDPDIFTAVSKKEEIREQLPALEEALNYSFHSECNGLDILRQGTIPCFRDGTLIVSGFWERRIEKCSDSKTYKEFGEFQADYPNNMSADMTEEEYQEIADAFIVSDETEVVANYQFDNIIYDGPAYEIIPLARFVYYPIYATSIKTMKLYGREYFLSKDKLREKAKRNEFYKDKVEQLIAKKPSGEKDSWSASKNFIDRLNVSPTEEDKPYKLVDAVWKEDLDNDGIPEKYLITFSADHDNLVLSVKNYHIRNNIDFCVDFRLASREDRFLGSSLLNEGMDKFNLLDTIHRNRNNVRMLTTSPIFLIDKRYKEELDFFRSENIIKPGATFWVEDPTKSIKQLQIQDLSTNNDSLDEENQIVRYLEFCLGPTQAMSGKETGSDPRAPMGKTIALLQQANGRIDDYLDEFRRTMPELASLHSALIAQYGPDEIKYNIEQDGKLTVKTADKKLFFDNSVIWRAKRRSVTLSPEFAMQRLAGLLQTYAQLLPLIQANDAKAIEMWNRMVIASGEPQKEKLMIQAQAAMNPLEQIMQQAGIGGQGAAQGNQTGMPPLTQSVASPSPKSPLNNV